MFHEYHMNLSISGICNYTDMIPETGPTDI